MIRYLSSKVVSGAEIHLRLLSQYGDSALMRRNMYEWIGKFKNGRASMTHEVARRPTTCTTDAKIQQAREMVTANWRIIIDEIAYFMLIRTTCICSDFGSYC